MTKIILHGGYEGFWDGAGSDVSLFTRLADEARKADGKVMISFLSNEKLEHFHFLDELKKCFKETAKDIELVIAEIGRAHV